MKCIFGWPEIRNCIIFGVAYDKKLRHSFILVRMVHGCFANVIKKKMKKRFKVVICRKFEIFSAKSDSLLSNFDV